MVLSETWFIEGYVDFELQKYRLLAYLNEVNKEFTQTRLYPQLSDIISHFNNLMQFRENKKLMEDNFPKQLDRVKLQQLELVYKKMIADDEVMQELEQIIQYSLAQMKGTIDKGAEIYEIVEKQMRIEPVGIMPLYKNEGYMLLRYGRQSEVMAYAYTTTLFERQSSKYCGLHIHYIDSWSKTPVNTYEQIKLDIIRQCRTLPQPAVYCVESPMALPLNETLLPIAKRLLVQQLGIA